MKVRIDGNEAELHPVPDVHVAEVGDRLMVRTAEGSFTALAVRSGGKTYVSYRGRTYLIEKALPGKLKAGGEVSGEQRAPMPGLVVEVHARVGATVEKGERLLIVEAMKMQQSIVAPFAGTVSALPVEKGQQVAEGDLLVRVDP
ncbi:MAG: biotin/lipoyl-binding protein [Chthonomonas sp.]|nr:biotin/lipoyl-binding protein [Chthonomonas sp.]